MVARVIVGVTRPGADRLFDYAVPQGMPVCVGSRVIVPFGGRNVKTEGYVLSLAESTEIVPERLKPILEIPDGAKPTFTPALLALAEWMRERYFCSLNQCLQAILPPGIRTKSRWAVWRGENADAAKPTPKEGRVLDFLAEQNGAAPEDILAACGANLAFLRGMEEKGLLELQQVLHRGVSQRTVTRYALDLAHPALEVVRRQAAESPRLAGQRRLLEILADGKARSTAELKAMGIADSPLRTLRKKGVLREEKTAEAKPIPPKTAPFCPTAEQAAALRAIRAEGERAEKRPILLHGVTGSGKTEIYLQIIADVLAQGRQAIVLVPEIALTPLLAERFYARFGDAVSVTHSRLSAGERAEQWKKARDGEISVVIGPRSALFLPLPQVGAIIMDEAHETSYVSDITPKYDTKEVAAELARLYGALFLMGTATPDLVSYYRAKKGESLLLRLRERTAGGSLPQVFVTDLRQELAAGNRSAFSRALQDAIRENLRRGRQTMLFLNRRGYATFVSCRSCGMAMTCPKCGIPYTYHAKENALLCHYCGRKETPPRLCPACGSKYIRYFGTGTQKIEEEARQLFPTARLLRMDLDTTVAKHSHERILAAFGRGEADILIGTQMIAKGHDYPNVTLVGILAADLSLHTDSYTAAETAFRLMVQAAGRAGRRDAEGQVFLQTYQPEHYAVQYAAKQDVDGFCETELAMREMMGYPPFASFFRIVLTGADGGAVAQAAQELAARIAAADSAGIATLLGPIALPQFRGTARMQLLVKAAEEDALRRLVLPQVAELRGGKGGVRVQLALNPTNVV